MRSIGPLFHIIGLAASTCTPRNQEAESCDQLIYIFVNPTSGGNEASTFIKTGVDYYHFGEPGHVSHVYISDIREGSRGNKAGFRKLATETMENDCVSPENPVRVVVAGGDGTVVWAMQEALEHKVPMDHVAFGTVPYGTGNDFGRVFGWGYTSPREIFNNEMAVFKNLVQSWLRAEIDDFDLWEVKIELTRNGRIKKWKNKSTAVLRNNRGKPVKTLSKIMSNYFSIGVESQIGIQFDRQRTQSQTLNQGIYALEGMKHMLKSTDRVADAVEECTNGDHVVFTTNTSLPHYPQLRGNPVSLIFLNIKSFAGGCDLWSDATSFGLVNHEPLGFDEPSHSDGKLEMMTYQSVLGFGWEQLRRLYRFMPSYGQKIAQVDNEIHINFKPGASIHAQVDGEFYFLQLPRRIAIRRSGKTKVLKRLELINDDESDSEF
jgi:diacylglycerol kinase (ATP)